MYFSPEAFPFTRILEAGWADIRRELEDLHQGSFVPWPERFLYGQGWDVFGLYAFGRKLQQNCDLCPQTTRLVEQVPGLTTAGFSSLAPGTHIAPHTGYTTAVLRCHLGLIVPEGCKMRVGSEVRQWEEGKTLVFDDTVEHEVWHNGDRPRIILLLDFRKTAEQPAQRLVPEEIIHAVRQAAPE